MKKKKKINTPNQKLILETYKTVANNMMDCGKDASGVVKRYNTLVEKYKK
jgi:hypothetical protein|tara:strand:- start:305 stop:454 length:150 start_codon:yes stop_codon:yes gene_type:complete